MDQGSQKGINEGWPEFPADFGPGECAEFHHGASAPPLKALAFRGNVPLERGSSPGGAFHHARILPARSERPKWADKCAVGQLLVVYYQR